MAIFNFEKKSNPIDPVRWTKGNQNHLGGFGHGTQLRVCVWRTVFAAAQYSRQFEKNKKKLRKMGATNYVRV